MSTNKFLWKPPGPSAIEAAPEPPPMPLDVAISYELFDLLAEIQPHETRITFKVECEDGAITIAGNAHSSDHYRLLVEAVPRMNMISGVKSVDITGVPKR